MKREQKLILVADEQTLLKISGNAPGNNIAKNVAAIPSAYINIGLFLLSRHKDHQSHSVSLIDRCLKVIQNAIGITTEINFVPLEKANTISLSMGEMPRNGCLYISHLIQDDLFIPFVEYNKHLAKEKNNVFMELAAALGAKSIHLENASFYNTKGKMETDFSVLNTVAIDVGINASFEKDGSVRKEVYSTFDKPRREPKVPAHLQRWVDLDTDLRLMSTHRLEHGLLSHKITLHFNDSLNGAAEAAAKITGINKSFGFKSSASKHISSSWVFEVEYHPINDK